MRTIIAGSRTATSYNDLLRAMVEIQWEPTEIISGTARGADKLGEQWAVENDVPLKQFPADWNRLGKRAGYLRNIHMAENADALIALWDFTSRGTKHMIDIARKHDLTVFVWDIR